MNNVDKTDNFLNVGTGYDINIKDLVELISNKVGYEGKIVFDITKPTGMKRKCLDVSKINNLGWKAKTSLENGIEQTIRYYRILDEQD